MTNKELLDEIEMLEEEYRKATYQTGKLQIGRQLRAKLLIYAEREKAEREENGIV